MPSNSAHFEPLARFAPIERYSQHGLRFRPDLYEHLPMCDTEEESVEAEKHLTSDLEGQGYRVWGGTRGLRESFT